MKSMICIFASTLLVMTGVFQAYAAVIEERIYDGSVATRGQFPWAAYLNITSDSGQNYECGGTLISDRYVLTAAQCVDKAKSVTILLGLQRSNDESGTMKYVIDKDAITLYPTWNPAKGNDNLALLKLPSLVDLYKYEYVDIIRLPVPSSLSQYVNKEAVAQGWGQYNNSPKNSIDLRYTPVEIMSKKECKKFFKPYPVSDGTLCAKKTKHRGPCSGDTGAPLTTNLTNGDPILLGVASYQLGRCRSSTPAVYSYMGYATYLDWIHNATGIGSLGYNAFVTTVAPQ